MRCEQAIFTSAARRGRSGYHLVARSSGVTASEAATIEAWSPSHGGLLTDETNRVSINFLRLPSGRHALSRTVEGRAEYSGRGGRELYTHALVLDPEILRRSGYQPFSLYRDALALGLLHYRGEVPDTLSRPALSSLHLRSEPSRWEGLVRAVGWSQFRGLVAEVEAGRPLQIPYGGDRAALAEALLSHVEPERVTDVSFATSLQPSAVRPFLFQLVAGPG